MHRKIPILICDEDHAFANPIFPDLDSLTSNEIAELAINPPTAKELRREAKKAGWGRLYGADYCPVCWAGMAERDSE